MNFVRNSFRLSFLIVLLALSNITLSVAQSKKVPQENEEVTSTDTTNWQRLREKLVFGGNVNGFFSSWGSFAQLSPLVGYKVTDKLIMGAGPEFYYVSYRYPGQTLRFFSYGVRGYGQYNFVPNGFVHAELGALNSAYEDLNADDYISRKWIVNPLVGAGYSQPLGRRGVIQVQALTHLNFKAIEDQPIAAQYYPIPVINVPVMFRIGVFF